MVDNTRLQLDSGDISTIVMIGSVSNSGARFSSRVFDQGVVGRVSSSEVRRTPPFQRIRYTAARLRKSLKGSTFCG